MVFDAACRLERDPFRAQRLAWEGVTLAR